MTHFLSKNNTIYFRLIWVPHREYPIYDTNKRRILWTNAVYFFLIRTKIGITNDGEKIASIGTTHTVPIPTRGYAVDGPTSPFKVFEFERRVPKADDVLILIHYCGICHSDIHQTRDEWANAKYPMVPGHEITGVVEQVGSSVRRFRAGDHVGVGCLVDSCLRCTPCEKCVFI